MNYPLFHDEDAPLDEAVYETVVPEGVQIARGELGEALMHDGDAKDAGIERAIAALAEVKVPTSYRRYQAAAKAQGASDALAARYAREMVDEIGF